MKPCPAIDRPDRFGRANLRPGSNSRPAPAAPRRATAAWRGLGFALFLGLVLRCGGVDTTNQTQAYQTTLQEYMAQQDKVRSNELYQLQQAAETERRTAFEAALTEHLQTLQESAQRVPPPAPEHASLAWTLVVVLTLILVFRVPAPRLVAYLLQRFDPWAPSMVNAAATALAPHLLAEDPAWTNFLRTMEEGVKSLAKETAAAAAAAPDQTGPGAPADPSRFFENAPKDLAQLRALFAEFSRPSEGPKAAAKVLELLRQVQAFKESASAPELLPVRQLTAALVGLLSQLAKHPANLTPSTLRTLAAAFDLLKDLCVRGVKPTLACEPPVRLLAVDDEPLTRGLVSRALQKVFGAPDLSSGGEDALTRAAQHAYDLIFLDVEMPGMDGYELCQKLHALPLNAATPVVFVTRHSDFQARAKSTLHGAQDLIAKPFLAFELALKALTLLLRNRLSPGKLAPATVPAAATALLAQATAESTPAPAAPTVSVTPESLATTASDSNSRPSSELSPALPTTAEQTPPPPAPGVLAAPRLVSSARPAPAAPAKLSASTKALLAQAAAQFSSFRDQLGLVRSSVKPEEINALLAKFYPSIASFCSEAYRNNLNAAFRLGSALEAMLKKLLEKPKLRPPSTLESLALALEVLSDLARSGLDLDLDETPVHLLVVDDDLLARRMMGEALQMAFGRPESAESGEAAVALARTKAFDLIYLDVLMPGLNGFEACSEIRQTDLNRSTPVMFVTSQGDVESRERGTASGGSGFIVKPTLPCEITLVTVSQLLRHRLDAVAAPVAEAPSADAKQEKPRPTPVLPRKQRRRAAARQRRQEAAEVTKS